MVQDAMNWVYSNATTMKAAIDDDVAWLRAHAGSLSQEQSYRMQAAIQGELQVLNSVLSLGQRIQSAFGGSVTLSGYEGSVGLGIAPLVVVGAIVAVAAAIGAAALLTYIVANWQKYRAEADAIREQTSAVQAVQQKYEAGKAPISDLLSVVGQQGSVLRSVPWGWVVGGGIGLAVFLLVVKR
jgi:hypothetical protein